MLLPHPTGHEAQRDQRDRFEARRMGITVEQYRAKLAEVTASDHPVTVSANKMFNEWRVSDSELPYWAWVAKGS